MVEALFIHDEATPLVFTSGTFFLLFSAFLVGYAWLLPRRWLRTLFVFLFSLYYYYRCNGVFVAALLATTVIDFELARQLARSADPRAKKQLVAASVALNLSILGYFKYTNFFLESGAALLGQSFTRLDIFLPIGISFYTFQSLSYVIDVYRGDTEPTENLLDYAFYLSFFPQVVAGPIVRARDLLAQVEREPPIDRDAVSDGLFLIVRGVAKKALLADYIAVYVDLVFAQPSAYHGAEVLLAIYGYAVQIYFDFSGYSDIAIGMARCMGYAFPDNFRTPYRAVHITEFWQRWHISLSTWLRDYLYIPLGGNRGGRRRRDRNLLITMLLGGLWHGASWNFVVWGGMHGLALVAHKRWTEWRGETIRVPSWLSGLVTFHFVAAAWVFFRAPTFGDAAAIGRQLLTLPEGWAYLTTVLSARSTMFAVIGLSLVLSVLPERTDGWAQRHYRRLPRLARALTLLVVIQGVLQLELTDVQPFIYFQF